MIKKALGKGLGAIIETEEPIEPGVLELRLNEVEPNTAQPRKKFDDEKLHQLAESIKQHGVVQPIIVKRDGERYRIIAGERRWRAARIAGLTVIPTIVRDMTSRQMMEIALIENIQREDLNPIEEAEAFDRLIKEYNMTQEDVAGAVGKSRPAIANALRLLALDEKIKNAVIGGEMSSSHARAILAVDDEDMRKKLADEIITKQLNVRDTEKLVKKTLSIKRTKKPTTLQDEYRDMEEKLKNIFGTRVKLSSGRKQGKITIEYYSSDELERILDILTGFKT